MLLLLVQPTYAANLTDWAIIEEDGSEKLVVLDQASKVDEPTSSQRTRDQSSPTEVQAAYTKDQQLITVAERYSLRERFMQTAGVLTGTMGFYLRSMREYVDSLFVDIGSVFEDVED